MPSINLNLSEYKYLGAATVSNSGKIMSAWLHIPTGTVYYCNGKLNQALQNISNTARGLKYR